MRADADGGNFYDYDAVDDAMEEEETSVGASVTVKPRQYFPETWLWQSALAG